jgi:membrane fusion protein, multidrug efflux system
MRTSRRRIIAALSILIVVVIAAAGVVIRLNGEKAGTNASASRSGVNLPDVSASEQFGTDMAVPVEGAEVVLDTLVLSVSAAGQAAASRQIVVKSQVAGQVRAVRVVENGAVGAGALLIEIDPTEYQLTLDESRARLRETEARYREITLGDDRISDAGVRAERDSAARARSGLDVARVAVRRSVINLARTRVTAPFAGRIANVRVVAGQHVNSGEDLLTVQSVDPIKVEAQVLEGEIGFLAPGRLARVTFAAFPGEVFEGRIESLNPVVAQQTRTARVTIAVRNPGGRVLPGMYARAALPARRFENRVLIPREALLERDGRNMLFVFKGDGTAGRAKWRYVNPGLMNDRLVEILEEGPESDVVRPGEWVIIGGHNTLTHDIPVRLVQNAQAEGGRPR